MAEQKCPLPAHRPPSLHILGSGTRSLSPKSVALRRLFFASRRLHHARPGVRRTRTPGSRPLGRWRPERGKTTLTRLLAGKYDLKIYNADWHHVREHRGRPGGVVKGWDELTMDERWIRPSPRELYERESANWTASFPLVVEDLLALPDDRTIVAEGPALFPWCIAPLLLSATQAIFLLPTAEVRERVLARRNRDGPASSDRFTTDPERARRNIAARDALLRERIASSCDEL